MHACGIWWVNFYFLILAGIPFLGCGYQLSGNNGRPLQLIAGGVQPLHGCIGRCVMHAGEVVLQLILVGVFTFSNCGCGSGFQLVG
jgi:hypothetical protein